MLLAKPWMLSEKDRALCFVPFGIVVKGCQQEATIHFGSPLFSEEFAPTTCSEELAQTTCWENLLPRAAIAFGPPPPSSSHFPLLVLQGIDRYWKEELFLVDKTVTGSSPWPPTKMQLEVAPAPAAPPPQTSGPVSGDARPGALWPGHRGQLRGGHPAPRALGRHLARR